MQDDKIHSIIAEPNKKKGRRGLIIAIITVVVLAAGVGVGIFLVQQNQEIRNQAATAGTCAYTVTGECLSTEIWCQKDLRCYPANKDSQVKCTDAETPEDIDKRIDTACGNGNNVTICGKSQTWSKFDKELEGANYPGPFNHARTEARAYIGAACPETLAQAAQQQAASPSPTDQAAAAAEQATATPTPTATSSSQSTQTDSPTATPTPTATSTSNLTTATATPAATSRVATVNTDQGIPQTGTGTPALIGTGVGLLLLVGAVILAL